MRLKRLCAIAPVGLFANFFPALPILLPELQVNVVAQIQPLTDSVLAPGGNSLSLLEKAVVEEMNRVRRDPAAYISLLEERRKYFKGYILQIPGEIKLITNEGGKAVDEAIRFLKSAKPLPPLRVSKGMSLGAKDRLTDRVPQGEFGHAGSDGSLPWERISRYGFWKRFVGENITYGSKTAENVLMQLIIDDGVRDRARRFNLFKPEYRVTGVACGSHKQREMMCVITYAEGYIEHR